MNYDVGSVPCMTVNRADQLDELAAALAAAERVAIDTETPIDGPKAGTMRVMSVALRLGDQREQAFVIDARDLDPRLLAPILTGITADAWNADFDARVVDAAVWQSSDVTTGLTWWDGLLADALLCQGRSGFTWYHGLAWAVEHYLGVEAEGKGTTQLSYDAGSDLSDDQIAYAAADALHTLWVGDVLRAELTKAGLNEVDRIEQQARPFLDRMQRFGLPFDWTGWRTELDELESQRQEVLTSLARLTGGGQGSLFDTSLTPSWNPASDPQVKEALNRWAPDEVAAWTRSRFGTPRPLTTIDSVTASVLKELGGELAATLLRFRVLTKTLTTYGESIREHLGPDSRLRPQYLQVVGTNTGRLASRNPNAQNFTPQMKPYFRPSDDRRVFVYADLSQAELRYLAQVANDEPLRRAFAAGIDVHVSTAASMFGFDPDQLLQSDPDRYKHLRQTAKALNFGIAYGSGATALGRSLTAEGNPTTTEEAEGLLDRYRLTYPGTTAWANERVAEIKTLSRRVVEVADWSLTLRLARGWPTMASLRRGLRSSLNRYPSPAEIAAVHPERMNRPIKSLTAEIDWLTRYSAPVVLEADGEPFTFASRTLAGRRQQFNLHTDRVFLVAALEGVESPREEYVAVRDRFATDFGLKLNPDRLGPAELSRQFDYRPHRRLYLEALARSVGETEVYNLLNRAASERVLAMVNAWRNAPIQGGVADIMLAAYGDLHHRLVGYDQAVPVQTVHDSVTVECWRGDAEAVAAEVEAALEQASRRYCPDVVPKADVDIRLSLADRDVLVLNSVLDSG